MRRAPLKVWLLVLCLLAGRFALAAHDVLHASGSPPAHACVACLHGGGADAVSIPVASFAVVAPAVVSASVATPAVPALRIVRRYQGRAPPHPLA